MRSAVYRVSHRSSGRTMAGNGLGYLSMLQMSPLYEPSSVSAHNFTAIGKNTVTNEGCCEAYVHMSPRGDSGCGDDVALMQAAPHCRVVRRWDVQCINLFEKAHYFIFKRQGMHANVVSKSMIHSPCASTCVTTSYKITRRQLTPGFPPLVCRSKARRATHHQLNHQQPINMLLEL